MTVTLYDSRTSLPPARGSHIFVFTGYTSNTAGETTGIITEVTCTYTFGDQLIVFMRNADGSSQRFEDALRWAVKRAKIFDIDDVHAVFELNRPIDNEFLNKLCPEGIVDCRNQLPSPSATAPKNHKQLSVKKRNTGNTQAIRRRLVFRNRDSVNKPDRHFVRAH